MLASVFGCTGSIGTNTLEVLTGLGIEVAALAAGRDHKKMETLARTHRPRVVAMYDENAANLLKVSLADTDITVLGGPDGVVEAATYTNDVFVNAIVGIAGLRPTLAAMDHTRRIALANKETLVCAGSIVLERAKQCNVEIIPVDSEHSAIFQALQGSGGRKEISKILLTASGGPFFGSNREDLKDVTLEQALKHPNWDMGAKITVDSATLMNKGLEVIEAVHLFDIPVDKIEVLVHRESIIHSMVEFIDGSVIAQMGVPDMKIPIQYAITYPDRVPSDVERMDLIKTGTLTFYEPDYNTFPCLGYAIDSVRGGGGPCVRLNAANEAAVGLLLDGRVRFSQVPEEVHRAINNISVPADPSVDEIFQIDTEVRRYVIGR